ncbi:hypothetical protein BLNAU_23915 [Blattamonas nauphoetae]|uniref:Uncharacterized protein n=1 Tax=Blattamonas nauphoetae TaxID=2049346 RepID=A0ABQ9WQX6_9EUKA|nr:hypothetical protein BLNAU_23915 [Blattamonas nauphoetae]
MRTRRFKRRHKVHRKTPVRLTKIHFFDAHDDVSINFGQLVPNPTPSLTKDEERDEERRVVHILRIVFWEDSGVQSLFKSKYNRARERESGVEIGRNEEEGREMVEISCSDVCGVGVLWLFLHAAVFASAGSPQVSQQQSRLSLESGWMRQCVEEELSCQPLLTNLSSHFVEISNHRRSDEHRITGK